MAKIRTAVIPVLWTRPSCNGRGNRVQARKTEAAGLELVELELVEVDIIQEEEPQRHNISSSHSPGDASSSTPAAQDDALSSLIHTLESEFSDSDDGVMDADGKPYLAFASLAGIVLLLGGGVLLKGHLQGFLEFFITAAEEWGPLGYVAYAAAYTALEVLAVPAIPLTMTAGVIFGPAVGTAIVLSSGTLAATIAFLIARYAARDKVLEFAKKNKKFGAIDRAIGKDGFKFVTLLRLSPLLPLAASNYLYGLTSVNLTPYVLGTFVGMLPGTYAIVTTGHVGKAVFLDGAEGSVSPELWQVGLGLAGTAVALGFVGRIAQRAIEEVEKEDKSDDAPFT